MNQEQIDELCRLKQECLDKQKVINKQHRDEKINHVTYGTRTHELVQEYAIKYFDVVMR